LTISAGTLIISPGSIISQWESEIKRHAPSLKVYMYLGRRSDPFVTSEELSKYDIVLTHYEVYVQCEYTYNKTNYLIH
jgi:E3 ubiquitin-protein ligase SHPRH